MYTILLIQLFTLLTTGCGTAYTERKESPYPKNSLQTVSELKTGRAAHAAVLLKNGKVLVTGGFGHDQKALDSAELFDPGSKTFAQASGMHAARSGHTATLLHDGRVLIAGGFNGSYLDSAEIYDPETAQFKPTSRMTIARNGHTATVLDDGRVLLAGGTGTGWSFLADAEIFDPNTDTFAKTGAMTTARESHTATRLSDGRVLVTGGHRGRRQAMVIFSTAEIYDPRSGSFSAAGEMTIKRHKHDAVLTKDGRVLIIGGSNERDSAGKYRSVEAFDPANNKFSGVGEMKMERFKHIGTSILLPNGKILIAGGADRAELFDPETGRSDLAEGKLSGYSSFSTATLLKDGSVLITGGYNDQIAVSTAAYVFVP